ncbi:hypothetical protein WCP94_000276 (plasmid) [Bilophila wadsworthia]|uniref:hypothetical protein n=1 Tax=Bilophila wadsworthia TaxID=35833 RepID=UPI003D6FD412
MSLYFSISAPSGKFLCADALLDPSIHALKEASEKAAGTFTLSFSQDQCIWSVMMEAKDGKTTVINPHLYEKAKKFSMMIEGWNKEAD